MENQGPQALLHPGLRLTLKMEWSEGAEGILGGFLQMVPETYRPLAESSARDAAEGLAADRGADAVAVQDVVRGWIATTPAEQRDALVDVLEQLGLEPEAYADDLAAPEEEREA